MFRAGVVARGGRVNLSKFVPNRFMSATPFARREPATMRTQRLHLAGYHEVHGNSNSRRLAVELPLRVRVRKERDPLGFHRRL